MSDSVTFTRSKIEDFLICQRRFQLRYLRQLAWPMAPLLPAQTAAMQKGELFHQLIQRHFLDLPIPDEVLNQYEWIVRHWWQTFLQHGPQVETGERSLVEMTLTVPVGAHALLGRFDLIIVGEEQVRIFDWKTSPSRSADELKQDWQTRLYLALAAAGGTALSRPDLPPEQISMTYWYAQKPQESVTISYSQADHDQNWAEIQAIANNVDKLLANSEMWPLTNNLESCAYCPYRAYCGRFEVPSLVANILDERYEENESEAWGMEPEFG